MLEYVGDELRFVVEREADVDFRIDDAGHGADRLVRPAVIAGLPMLRRGVHLGGSLDGAVARIHEVARQRACALPTPDDQRVIVLAAVLPDAGRRPDQRRLLAVADQQDLVAAPSGVIEPPFRMASSAMGRTVPSPVAD